MTKLASTPWLWLLVMMIHGMMMIRPVDDEEAAAVPNVNKCRWSPLVVVICISTLTE